MNIKISEILNKETRTKYFVHFLILLSIVSIITFAITINSKKENFKNRIDKKINKKSYFEDLNLEAKSVMVFDIVKNKELYSKNKDLPLPLASITKVMTALTAYENIGENARIKIKNEYLTPTGDSNLKVGDEWKSKDLLDFTLITSSNDGAMAIASATKEINNGIKNTDFIKLMNEKAKEIGMNDSKFFNEHGLDEDTEIGGAYGSTKDISTLFSYVLLNHPHLLEATKYTDLSLKSFNEKYEAINTNDFINKIPNLIASKTGFTDLANGNLAIIFDAGLNRPIIIVVLGSSQTGRFTDTLMLIDKSIKYIQNNN